MAKRASRWSALNAGVIVAAALCASAGCNRERNAKEKLRRTPGTEAVVVASGTRTTAAGPLLKEVEPNDDPASLAPQEMPLQVAGELAPSITAPTALDVDHVVVRVPGTGTVSASVSPKPGLDVILAVVQDGVEVAVSDQGAAGKPEALPNWPVEAGVAILRVSEFRKKKDKSVSLTRSYVLDVRFVAAGSGEPALESEPNATLEESEVLAVGKRRFGFLGWAGDVDLWRIPIDSPVAGNVLDIFLDGVPGVAPTLSLTVSGEEKPMVSRTGQKGASLSIQSVKPKSGVGEYLVSVSGTRSNPTREYAVWMELRAPQAGEEHEPNDEPAQAEPLSRASASLGTQRGSFGPGDVDHFLLPGAGEFRVEVKPTRDGLARLSVVGGALVKGARGETIVLERIAVPADGKGVIRVEGRARGAASADYELRWQRLSP